MLLQSIGLVHYTIFLKTVCGYAYEFMWVLKSTMVTVIDITAAILT